MIPARMWRNMSTGDVISSIEVAVRVLKNRRLNKGEKQFILAVVEEILKLVAREMR